MKKIIALVLSLVLMSLTLVACSNGGTTPSVTPPTSTPAEAEMETETPTPAPTPDNVVEEVNGNRRFKTTRAEFTEKYDEIVAELDDYPLVTLSSRRGTVQSNEVVNGLKSLWPNVYTGYDYDTTIYPPGSTLLTNFVQIAVDDQDFVLCIAFARTGDALQTDDAKDYFLFTECVAAYMAITGETESTAKDKIRENFYENGGVSVSNGMYEYGFSSTSGNGFGLILRVVND